MPGKNQSHRISAGSAPDQPVGFGRAYRYAGPVGTKMV